MPYHTFIAMDIKSFYASVKCTDKRLAPLVTNFVVADGSQTEKIICQAISPVAEDLRHPQTGSVGIWRLPKNVKQQIIAQKIL